LFAENVLVRVGIDFVRFNEYFWLLYFDRRLEFKVALVASVSPLAARFFGNRSFHWVPLVVVFMGTQ